MWIFLEVPGCHLLRQRSLQWGSQKLFQGSVSHVLTAYLSHFYLFFDSTKSLYFQRYVNQNFVWCEFFLKSSSPDILALCETNLDDSIDSVRGYLSLNRKYSVTRIHDLVFVALYLYKSTIRHFLEYCCHVWAGAPSCYLDMLDKIKKRTFRTVGPSLATLLNS